MKAEDWRCDGRGRFRPGRQPPRLPDSALSSRIYCDAESAPADGATARFRLDQRASRAGAADACGPARL